MLKTLKTAFLRDERGVTMIEYALMAAIMAAALIPAATTLAVSNQAKVTELAVFLNGLGGSSQLGSPAQDEGS